MELIALLSSRDEIVIPYVKSVLKKYMVYPLKTFEELEDLYANIPLNLLLVDTGSHRISALESFLGKLDNDMVVLITEDKPDKYVMENLPDSIFECVELDSMRADLPAMVERALERQRYKNELNLLNQVREVTVPARIQTSGGTETDMFAARCDSLPGGRYIQKKVIVNFARMLTVNFDMRKLLDYFMDSVMEIARVSKMSVMLVDKEGFSVKTQYGLDPYIADNIKLRKDSALAVWLTKTGRIMHKPVCFVDSASVDVKNEMDILQCSVSFPMIYKGKLIGIFNVDGKITEESFNREELEVIYVFCNYLAAAVKDIDLYHQMRRRKEFTQNLLAGMDSGMIAIDNDQKITVFNRRASEILDIESSAMIGSDLRKLPSPLGDLLYETMVTGVSYKRYEVIINPVKIPIGINSYRLLNEEERPMGAGIVFSDLSDSKKLEEERSKSEKFEAVNDLMAKIANDVRIPLTSIQTHTQLLNEKSADDDLNKFYISTVQQSINSLDSLIDKLVMFSSTQDYNLEREEVNDVLREASDFIMKKLPETHEFSKQLMDKPFYVRADKKPLVKAIYYLILSIVERTPDGAYISMSADATFKENPMVEISITYGADELKREGGPDLLKPLDIDHLGTELNIPISHNIIEGHNGVLEVNNEGEINIVVIKLPIIDRRSRSRVSYRGGTSCER